MGFVLDTRATSPPDHVVLFYEQDHFLNECIAGYARQGLAEDRDVLVVATAPHRHALATLLDQPPQQAGGTARLAVLDAQETLDSLLADGFVDASRLHDRLAPWLAASNQGGCTPRVYGEMVVLLWNTGQFEAALQLKGLWNRLGESFSFSLLCGYPMRGFGEQDSSVSFLDVCQQHTAVTTESYARLRGETVGDTVPMVILNGGSPGGHIALT